MTTESSPWYKSQPEYFAGALFGIVTLDLFMFLIHAITEKTLSGYGLGILAITIPIVIVWYCEHLYRQQDSH